VLGIKISVKAIHLSFAVSFLFQSILITVFMNLDMHTKQLHIQQQKWENAYVHYCAVYIVRYSILIDYTQRYYGSLGPWPWPWFIPHLRGQIGPYSTPSVSVKSCHFCFFPGKLHLLYVFVDCASPIRSWSTWSSLVSWYLPIQCLLWYALNMHVLANAVFYAVHYDVCVTMCICEAVR